MRKALKRIWTDVSQGDNIDLYVTLAFSIVLVVLNLVGVVNQAVTLPLILAVLALITFSLTGNRYRLQALLELAIAKDNAMLESFPDEFYSDLLKAREVWICAIHLSGLFTSDLARFQDMINRGVRLRVLVADPAGAVAGMTALRFSSRILPSQEAARIQSTLDTLGALTANSSAQVEIRTIDYLLERATFLIDPDTPHAVAYVERYTFRVQGGRRKPKLVYRRKDGQWFELTCSEVRALWEVGKPWRGPVQVQTKQAG